ncbi:MAG: putative 2OG-Fe(II) oxygenase [Litorimonas sp.]
MSLQSAHQAYQSGDLNQAETLLGLHLLTYPDDARALHLGALVAHRRRDFPTALTRIVEASRDAGNLHEKRNTEGNIRIALGDPLGAEAAFRAALAADPDYHPARFNLARHLFDQSAFREAADEFRHLAAAEPGNAIAWRGLLNASLEGLQLEEVAARLDEAPLPGAEKANIRARLAYCRNEFDAALEGLSSVIGDESVGAESFVLALQILHMQGRWAEARTFADKTLGAYPDNPKIWGPAIRAFYKAGDMAEAKRWLAAAPSGVAVDTVRLEILIEEKRFDEAEKAGLDALSGAPGYTPLMHRVCRAALGNSNPDLAQQVADFGLRATPNDQLYYAVKATAGRAKGQNYRWYFDYERFVRAYDLSAPDGWSDMASFNADLKAELEAHHGHSDAPLDQSLQTGTQTLADLRYIETPAIQGYFQAIDAAVRDYLETIGQDRTHAFLSRNTGAYRVRGAWSVRLRSGGHHVNHVHPAGWISSAYYVDVPSGRGKEGWIKFGEPPAPLGEALGQGPEHEIEPKPGRLVLFPSYLWHGTYPITGDKTRMTLPIDILPAAPA